MPGGLLIGILLLINLFLAQFRYFKAKFKKIGIYLIHNGIIILLLGEFIASFFKVESMMELDEGYKKNYSVVQNEVELAITDITNPKKNIVYTIPEKILKKGSFIEKQNLPFTLLIKKFNKNSSFIANKNNDNNINRGFAKEIKPIEKKITLKDNELNLSSVVLDLIHKKENSNQKTIGTWLLSNAFTQKDLFSYNNKTYKIALRQRRIYYKFAIKLNKFHFENYKNSSIPKTYRSYIEYYDQDSPKGRDLLIYMNNPLRKQKVSMYQSSYRIDGENVKSILQIVKNPVNQFPYWSSIIVAIGMLWQFLVQLSSSVKKRY